MAILDLVFATPLQKNSNLEITFYKNDSQMSE